MPIEEKSAVVYITGERVLDFGPATVFGRLHMMKLGRPMPYADASVGARNDELVHRIRVELRDYVPGHDYICPVGAPVIMASVGMVLNDLGKGSHRFLGWDNHTKRYLEYRIQL